MGRQEYLYLLDAHVRFFFFLPHISTNPVQNVQTLSSEDFSELQVSVSQCQLHGLPMPTSRSLCVAALR